MAIVNPLSRVVGPLPNGLNSFQMGVANHLLTGMILRVGCIKPCNSWKKLQNYQLVIAGNFWTISSMSVPVFFREVSWDILDPYDLNIFFWGCMMISLNDVITKHHSVKFITCSLRDLDLKTAWVCEDNISNRIGCLSKWGTPKKLHPKSVSILSVVNWWDFLGENPIIFGVDQKFTSKLLM